MKIYTKTGDSGDTGLYGGLRVTKDSLRIEAIGDIDELNAQVGICRLNAHGVELDSVLLGIQSWLFDLGAEIASAPGKANSHVSGAESQISKIEVSIDVMSARLPELKNFILPGGSPLAAQLHLARVVCRRAERSVLRLHREQEVRPDVRILLNRLSDWFFVAARRANQLAGIEDVKWTS